jgi:hypothetical protein
MRGMIMSKHFNKGVWYSVFFVVGAVPSAVLILVFWLLAGLTKNWVAVPVLTAYVGLVYYSWFSWRTHPTDEERAQLPDELAWFLTGLFTPVAIAIVANFSSNLAFGLGLGVHIALIVMMLLAIMKERLQQEPAEGR